MRRSILLVLLLCAPARAQVKAVTVAPTEVSSPHRHGPAGAGLAVSFGWAGQRNGLRGWSARLEEEFLPLFEPGGFSGFMPGIEIWRSGEDNWGFSLPISIVGGVRLFPLRAVLGVGADAILVDQVDGDTGFGLYAPFAMGKLAFDVFGAQVGIDTRIGYRWQFGAEDHARWQLSFYVGYTAQPR